MLKKNQVKEFLEVEEKNIKRIVGDNPQLFLDRLLDMLPKNPIDYSGKITMKETNKIDREMRERVK